MMGRPSSKVLSQLDVDGTEVKDAKQVRDQFDSHFTRNPKSMHDSIPSPNVNFEISFNSSSMYLWHTTDSEVLAATKNLKKWQDK